ncbi:AbiV family abortive infection protein [Kitasatospora sp. NPDC093102]|uniref:AbiV family abortive infection protein n=1 Tax=Kitasatospora sp. NPDC093102 TaxID=3155069 RepID=UPI0034123F0D
MPRDNEAPVQDTPDTYDRQTLTELAQAAYRTSRALLLDAELLLENARWPRAHFLAAVSLEELARAQVLLLAEPSDLAAPGPGTPAGTPEGTPAAGPGEGAPVTRSVRPEAPQPSAAVKDPAGTAPADGESATSGRCTLPFLEGLAKSLPYSMPRWQVEELLDVAWMPKVAELQGLSTRYLGGRLTQPEDIDRATAERLVGLVRVAVEATEGLWRRCDELWTRVFGDFPVE